MRLAVHFRDKQEEGGTQDLNFPKVPSNSKRMPPKSVFPEVELFLANVRSDVLNLRNVRSCRNNLTKGELLTLRELKDSESVIRIQEKGSRFVVLDQSEYVKKIGSQLNNPLH